MVVSTESLQPGELDPVHAEQHLHPEAGEGVLVFAVEPFDEIVVDDMLKDPIDHNSTAIYEIRPDDVLTISQIAQQANVSHITVKRMLQKLGILSAAVKYQDTADGHIRSCYPTAVVEMVTAELYKYDEAPEDSFTVLTIADEAGVKFNTAQKAVKEIMQTNPGLFGTYRNTLNKPSLYCHSEAKSLIMEKLSAGIYQEVPDDESWHSWMKIAKQTGHAIEVVQRAAEGVRVSNPELIKKFRNRGRIFEYCNPQATALIIQKLAEYEHSPEGWQTTYGAALEAGVTFKVVDRIANLYRVSHPQYFHDYKTPRSRLTEFLHPELVTLIKQEISFKKAGLEERSVRKEEQSNLRRDLHEFLTDIDEGGSLEAHEFRELVELFGAERAVDILYHYRPQYSKLAVPYVRSTLADYLGDFMNIKGQFSLDSLEKSAGLLVEPSLREGMTEIVKNDCLRLLNRLGRTDITTVNMQTVLEYLAHIREQTANFTTPELQEVIDETEAYYQLLFENVHKPDSFVDELDAGRQFPDINQRINVQEIAFKHRVLIGDEMGTGKSASAIMAKEILGVKRALIVVPSNVLEVWQAYLSDGDGGYFKLGQAPRVVTIESPEDLRPLESQYFDYVIISQERLSEVYVEALSKCGYNMLIADEMHKLKNLVDGKRAEQLLKLAEQVEGNDKYLVLLSGTPVPNKISDVAMALKLLYPDQFREISNKELVSQILNGDILDLRSLLVTRMQMKTLAESVVMPKLRHDVHQFNLSLEAQDIYSFLVEEDELTATQKMQILRQFVLSPQLLDATPNIPNTKAQEVSRELHKTFSTKNRVVMFVNGYIEGVMRGENSILESLDLPKDVNVVTIDGSVSKERRLEIQQELQHADKKILLVVSGQTADVGVDFSAAEEVYFYSEPWTEYDKRQQLGRVYRPGLKNDLICHTFVASGTIEEGIHRYVESKYKAVEKLLRGVPISELEKELLRKSETQDQRLDVSPELAEYYFSSWDKMMKIYGHVKELGEEDFVKFLSRYDKEYANSYADLVGSRSYQANVGRLSGTIIGESVKSKGQQPTEVRILDIASGPEMLKRHVSEELSENIVSVDINKHHFSSPGTNRAVGSFLALPIASQSVDYANMSLALHYTNFLPHTHKYERLQALQELNRVLRIGGRGVVSMIYTLGLKDGPELRTTLDKLGFHVVEMLSGDAESGNHFKSQVITLEKVRDGDANMRALAAEIGPESLRSLKFSKSKTSLRDPRKIVTTFTLGKRLLSTILNQEDRRAQVEEQEVLQTMDQLKMRYGAVKDIPKEAIYETGFSRIFNGKRYVLFKRLKAGSGAVVIR